MRAFDVDGVRSVPVADTNPNGTYSPDEEADEKILIGRVRNQVAKWRDEAYRIGGPFRGPGIWQRVKHAMTS